MYIHIYISPYLYINKVNLIEKKICLSGCLVSCKQNNRFTKYFAIQPAVEGKRETERQTDRQSNLCTYLSSTVQDVLINLSAPFIFG